MRAELSAGQVAFLLGEPLPEGVSFAEAMRLTWLNAPWREGEEMPDGSPNAVRLRAEHAGEAARLARLARKPRRRPLTRGTSFTRSSGLRRGFTGDARGLDRRVHCKRWSGTPRIH